MILNNLPKDEIYMEWCDCSHTTFMCHDKIRREFYNYLAVKKKNVSDELVRLGIEDSHHRYYDPIRMVIKRGHIKNAFEFVKETGYKLNLGDNIKLIKSHHPKYDKSFFDTLPLTIDGVKVDPWKYPYDYQGKFIDWGLTNRTGIGISATGSGKTLINYCMIRYLQNEDTNSKILFIVPSVTLVNQGYSDFENYSEMDDTWNIEDHVSKLHGSVKEKKNFKNILITTWQSLKGKRKQFYEDYNHIFVDEVHGADADVLKKTIEKCTNAYTKIGGTGSLKGEGKNIDKAAEMELEGLFGGRIEVFSTARELMDRGVLPRLKILRSILKYDSQYNKDLMKSSKVIKEKKADYRDKLKIFNEEKAFIASIPERKIYLEDVYDRLKGNVIVFYNSIEHMKEAYESYSGTKNKHLIYGAISDKNRQDILYTQILKGEGEHILFATYGTLSTGISVNNLDIAVMAESMKSRVKVLQSIGRLLRGDRALLIDVDDMLTSTNYLHKHAMVKKELYDSVGYDYVEQIIQIKYSSAHKR